MDSSSPSTSGCDSSGPSDVRNGEGLAVDEIMRMKEKRLRLLDDYRNGQEENILPLMREAEDINRKKKKKPRSQPYAGNNTPLRRSERIMTQTLNGNRTSEGPMQQPQHEPGFEPEPAPMPEFEPEPAPMPEFGPEPEPMESETGPEPMESEMEPEPMESEMEPEPMESETEPESETESESETETESESTESESTESDTDPESTESETEPELLDELEQAPPRRGDAAQRVNSSRPTFDPQHSGRHLFDIPLASRRVFAVHPAPMRVIFPVPVPLWSRPPLLRNDNWYGAREGFDIGHHWNTRLECSHDRVHRPSIAGIHAGPEGAYSVALSGAYADDIDEGNVVIFTGAGGRDLKSPSGRSRSVRGAPQIRDQELNRANMSLIKSVITGNPVRLIRGYKLASSFAPEHGYRYDGLYRVVQYTYTIGRGGFRVFRFRMYRMENQTPPPWETGWIPQNNRRRPSRPWRGRRGRVQNGRFPDTGYSGELDDEIERCIRELCRNSSYRPADDDEDPSTPFRGWDMP